MTSLVQSEPPAQPRPEPDRLRLLPRVCGGLLVILLGAWTVHLLPQWLRNPDLSHGLFTPFVFILLLHEARSRGAARYLPSSRTLTLAVGALGATSLVLLGAAGLYAAALEWTHALVEFLLAGALCLLLTATALTVSMDRVRLVPFNWPAAVGVLVWALSAPIPPGTYTRLTQQLQSSVTESVLFSLQLLGIAASQDGNVINLAHTSVGVEEACSGVRSLLSCIFAGFFLSGVLCSRPWKRAVIVLAAGPLAIAMNFLRSLLLTLLANADIDIRGRWHDLTGFAILAITAAVLAGLALWLERLGQDLQAKGSMEGSAPWGPNDRGGPDGAGPSNYSVSAPSPSPVVVSGYPGRSARQTTFWAELLLLGSLVLSLATLVVFVVHTHPSKNRQEPVPNLWAMLPEAVEGWEVTTRTDLYRFSSQLQTDVLAERTYARADARGTLQLTVYVAYWPASQASVSLVAAHTPDACWPGSGWEEDRSQHRSISLDLGKTRLPPAQFRSFKLDTFPQNVWYWHLFDGKPIEGKVGSPRELLAMAWRYGFRNEEEQVFIRISSNRGWEEIAHEPLLAEIVARLGSLGLEAR